MSIREIVEGHYSQFISLVDLINATAATSGLDFDVVSNAFWRTRILDTVTHWKLCGKTGDLIESDGELNRSELAQFVGARPFKKLSDPQIQELIDFHHGFRTSEIKAAMIECGMETPLCLDEGAAPFVWVDPSVKPLYDRIATLQAEVERLRGELEQQKNPPATESHSKADIPHTPPTWTRHDTRLFNLLPQVIAEATGQPKWPAQKRFVPDLINRYGLSEAEAKALDAITRPDNLRKKTP